MIVCKLFQACSHFRIWESTARIIKYCIEIKERIMTTLLDSEIAINLKINFLLETFRKPKLENYVEVWWRLSWASVFLIVVYGHAECAHVKLRGIERSLPPPPCHWKEQVKIEKWKIICFIRCMNDLKFQGNFGLERDDSDVESTCCSSTGLSLPRSQRIGVLPGTWNSGNTLFWPLHTHIHICA